MPVPEFMALAPFASKEYIFEQGTSIARTGGRQDGVCFGLVMMWVQERFTTTRSLLPPGKQQDKKFSPAFDGRDIHQRNGTTVIRAAVYQELYAEEQGGDVVAVARALGLRNAAIANIQPAERPKTQEDLLRALKRAGESLPQGGAVVIELDVHDHPNRGLKGAHAVAMYRSRGGHLHFFDPNVGIYQVRNLGGFMDKWTEAYEDGRKERLFAPAARHPGQAWMHCYTR